MTCLGWCNRSVHERVHGGHQCTADTRVGLTFGLWTRACLVSIKGLRRRELDDEQGLLTPTYYMAFLVSLPKKKKKSTNVVPKGSDTPELHMHMRIHTCPAGGRIALSDRTRSGHRGSAAALPGLSGSALPVRTSAPPSESAGPACRPEVLQPFPLDWWRDNILD